MKPHIDPNRHPHNPERNHGAGVALDFGARVAPLILLIFGRRFATFVAVIILNLGSSLLTSYHLTGVFLVNCFITLGDVQMGTSDPD